MMSAILDAVCSRLCNAAQGDDVGLAWTLRARAAVVQLKAKAVT
jgi:hypothetical protein